MKFNTASAIGLFVLNAGIGFALVRLIVAALDRDSYGLYITISQTISNACLLLFVFNNNAARDVGIFHRSYRLAAEKLGKTCVLNVLGFSLALPLLLGFSLAVGKLFNMPAALIAPAMSLALLTTLSFLLSASFAVVTAFYVYKNEVWLGNLVQGISSLIRFALILACYYFGTLSLVSVGLGTLAGTTFSVVAALAIWQYRYPFLTLRFSRPSLKEAASAYLGGFHSFVGRGFETLIVNYELLLVNHLDFSTASRYATLLPVFTAARLLASFVYASLEPTWIMFREQGRLTDLFASVKAVQLRAVGLGLSAACLVSLWANELVGLWLGGMESRLGTLVGNYFPLFAAIVCFSSLHNVFYVLNDQTWQNVASGAVVGLLTIACGVLSAIGAFDIDCFLAVLLSCYALKNYLVLPILLKLRYATYRLPRAALCLSFLILGGYYAVRGLESWFYPEAGVLLRLFICAAVSVVVVFARQGTARARTQREKGVRNRFNTFPLQNGS